MSVCLGATAASFSGQCKTPALDRTPHNTRLSLLRILTLTTTFRTGKMFSARMAKRAQRPKQLLDFSASLYYPFRACSRRWMSARPEERQVVGTGKSSLLNLMSGEGLCPQADRCIVSRAASRQGSFLIKRFASIPLHTTMPGISMQSTAGSRAARSMMSDRRKATGHEARCRSPAQWKANTGIS